MGQGSDCFERRKLSEKDGKGKGKRVKRGRLEENGRDKGFPTRDYGDLERGLGFLTCAVRSLVRNLFLTFSRSFSSFLRRGRKMGKRDCGKREGKSLLYEDLSAVPRLR